MRWLLLMILLSGCVDSAETIDARLSGTFTEDRSQPDMAEVGEILAPYDVVIMESFPEQFSAVLPMSVCEERRPLLEGKPYLQSLSSCRAV